MINKKMDRIDRTLIEMADGTTSKKYDCESETELAIIKKVKKLLTCYLGVNPNMNHTSTASIDILTYRLLHVIKGVADMRGYSLTTNGLVGRNKEEHEEMEQANA